jgi:hypothetical protein
MKEAKKGVTILREYTLIGILVSKRNERKGTLQLYQRHHSLPLKLCAFAHKDVLWKKHKIVGLQLIGNKWTQRVLPFPQAVYNRCYNKSIASIRRLERVIGRGKCFNIINWFNKWEVYNFLRQSYLKRYVPDTFLLDEVDIAELIRVNKLLYIKPCYGNQGNSVYRLELKENGEIHISLHSLAPSFICRKGEDIRHKLGSFLGSDSYIVQKGVQSSRINQQYYDIRALVQKDISGRWRVSNRACRVAYELYFNTTVYQTILDADEILARLFPLRVMKEIALEAIDEVSVNAALVLESHVAGLGELSVDFVLDREMKLWIIEINGKPQKTIYQDMKNSKSADLVYRRPLEYSYYLSRQP